MPAKIPSDVLGFRMHCPNFVQCPFCFGCRAYNSANLECLKCAENKKLNICNIKLHKTDLIAKMITKSTIKTNKANFISSFNERSER